MTTTLPGWMGKYPRKGADWSPGEDAQLESVMGTRIFIADVAARHLREPVAIERRLALLRERERLDAVKTTPPRKTWQQEQETARWYLNGIMLKHLGNTVIIPLTDLPPEVAQALQFGTGEAHAHD